MSGTTMSVVPILSLRADTGRSGTLVPMSTPALALRNGTLTLSRHGVTAER
jgi:hypothetical protein